MERFIRWMLRRPAAWGVVSTGLLLAALGAAAMVGLRQDDDLLSFFPADEPGAAAFRDIQQRFGGMRAAVVGIATDDALDPRFLSKLAQVTAGVRRVPGIKELLSLSNVPDFTADPTNGGVTTSPLIGALPRTEAEVRALRERVMSRSQVVGQLVSEDGKAALVVSLLTDASDVIATARAIQRQVLTVFSPGEVFWVGAPFVSAYLQGAVLADVPRIGLWMACFLLLSAAWFLRDPISVLGMLLTPGIGLLAALGLMALFGVQLDLLSGLMPVLVFVIGSAFAWVVLLRCRLEAARGRGLADALERGVYRSAPLIAAAGLSAAGAMLFLLLPQIEPFRSVGAFGAAGILLCAVLSLTFLPALVGLAGGARALRRRRAFPWGFDLGLWLHAQRRWFVWTWVLVTVWCLWTIRGLSVGMDAAAMFAADSPPGRADRFLERHFGGSQYLFIQVRGDMNDPAVVRHVQWLADRIALLPHVSQVLHVGQLLATSNEVVAGQRRIPDTREQISINYSFLSSQPALAQVIAADRQKGLIHVKIDTASGDAQAGLVRAIEEWTGPDRSQTAVSRVEQVSYRVRALLHSFGLAVEEPLLASALEGEPPPVPAARVSARVLAFLGSSECAIDPAEIDPALPPRIAQALTALGEEAAPEAISAALARLLPGDRKDAVDELAQSVETPLAEAWQESRAAIRATGLIHKAGWSIPAGLRGESFTTALEAALRELDAPEPAAVLASAGRAPRVEFDLSGLPVLRDALARYLRRTQLTEILLSWGWTVLVMALFFRSLRAGVFASMPGCVALLLIGAVMALSGAVMNVGSVPLVPMMIGLGCLYSGWYSQRMGDLGGALRFEGAGVTGHALTTGGAFFFLLLAELPVMRQAGAWIGLGILVCALGSLLLWPLGAPEAPLGPAQEGTEKGKWKSAELGESI